MTVKCVSIRRTPIASAKTEGECLADVPWKFFYGQETRKPRLGESSQNQNNDHSDENLHCGLWRSGELVCGASGKGGEAEIWAYDVWKEHTDAIRQTGLQALRGRRIHGQAECHQ